MSVTRWRVAVSRAPASRSGIDAASRRRDARLLIRRSGGVLEILLARASVLARVSLSRDASLLIRRSARADAAGPAAGPASLCPAVPGDRVPRASQLVPGAGPGRRRNSQNASQRAGGLAVACGAAARFPSRGPRSRAARPRSDSRNTSRPAGGRTLEYGFAGSTSSRKRPRARPTMQQRGPRRSGPAPTSRPGCRDTLTGGWKLGVDGDTRAGIRVPRLARVAARQVDRSTAGQAVAQEQRKCSGRASEGTPPMRA